MWIEHQSGSQSSHAKNTDSRKKLNGKVKDTLKDSLLC